MYASRQGRWFTPDPVRSCPFHPENLDRYSYAGNNPAGPIDPRRDAIYFPTYDEFDYLEEFGFLPAGEIVFEGAGVALCPECVIAVVVGAVVAYQVYLYGHRQAQHDADIAVCRALHSRPCYDQAMQRFAAYPCPAVPYLHFLTGCQDIES